MPHEIEIKFLVHDLAALRERLLKAGFHEVTPRTHELNSVYDTDRATLAASGQLLRLRRYGDRWTLTHKGVVTSSGKHKTRAETETRVQDGEAMHAILSALGFHIRFRYEKFRTEFADAKHSGHVMIDETPIGDVAEIEGDPEWIDEIARLLGIHESDYITLSYGAMFQAWRERTGSTAMDMTWDAIAPANKLH
ncbi:MAG: class IV adenylate cyclase [Acidobacteriales bacterium]|nr:class IV adenylate cyclase [Terriglobales bacterium]